MQRDDSLYLIVSKETCLATIKTRKPDETKPDEWGDGHILIRVHVEDIHFIDFEIIKRIKLSYSAHDKGIIESAEAGQDEK